jgi:hypothetical protein
MTTTHRFVALKIVFFWGGGYSFFVAANTSLIPFDLTARKFSWVKNEKLVFRSRLGIFSQFNLKNLRLILANSKV